MYCYKIYVYHHIVGMMIKEFILTSQFRVTIENSIHFLHNYSFQYMRSKEYKAAFILRIS